MPPLDIITFSGLKTMIKEGLISHDTESHGTRRFQDVIVSWHYGAQNGFVARQRAV